MKLAEHEPTQHHDIANIKLPVIAESNLKRVSFTERQNH